jgi:hypothetical protein
MTRFNLVLPFKANKYSGKGALKGSGDYHRWLEGRLRLFEDFCLPSILNQHKRPDVWLLGISGERNDLTEQLREIIRPHDWIVTVAQRMCGDGHEHPQRLFQREARPRIDPRSTHVISTRLDSDDALNRSFFSYLALYVSATLEARKDLEDFWVAFPTGAQFASGECRLYNYPANHFLSRAVAIKSFLSRPSANACYGAHGDAYKMGPMFLAVTTEPMWLQNVHGGNVTNHLREGLPRLASTGKLLAACGIHLPWRKRLLGPLPARAAAAFKVLRGGVKKGLRAAGLMKPKPTGRKEWPLQVP